MVKNLPLLMLLCKVWAIGGWSGRGYTRLLEAKESRGLVAHLSPVRGVLELAWLPYAEVVEAFLLVGL